IVNDLPVISVNDEEICLGVQIVLKASGGEKYVWKNVTTDLSSTTISNPTASPKTTTTYTVEVTDANNCVSEKDVKVTVNDLPTITVSNETICLNDQVELKADGGTKYVWKNVITDLSATTISNPIASPKITTTYTVEVTDANNCVSEEDVKVIVNDLPIISVSDETICLNDQVVLKASGGINYVWRNITTDLSSTTISNPIASPKATTTYTVEVTDANSCVSEKDVIVTVNPLPSPTFDNPQTIVCPKEVVTYKINGGSGSTFMWNFLPSNKITSDNESNDQNTITFSEILDGKVTLEVEEEDIKGCKSKVSQEVTIDDITTLGFDLIDEICEDNSSISLDMATSTTNGTGTYKYNGNEITEIVPNDAQFIKNIPLTILYDFVTTQGCKYSISENITIHTLPVISFTSIPDICSNSSAYVLDEASPINGVYSGVGVEKGKFNPLATGVKIDDKNEITYTYTDQNGCVNSQTSEIMVHQQPTVSIENELFLCEGDQKIFTTQVSNPNVSYTWYQDGTALSQKASTLKVDEVGTYQVEITYEVCKNTSEEKEVDLMLIDVEAGKDQTIMWDEEGVLSAVIDATNEYTVKWEGDNNQTFSEEEVRVTLEETTTYTIIVTDEYGCMASDDVTITLLPQIIVPNGFSPNGDGLNEEWIIKNIEDYPNAIVKIFNRWGDVVFTTYGGYENDWTGMSEGTPLPNATYYYTIDLNHNSLVYSGSISIIR
ncbi:MAG: gliding motility-associated C-terminal domain-containing protein, partial [Cytophagales bacterium]|nr:gliding motility-associated C-terminal domain-containing protein [Cytophagales bacterium]